MTPSVRFHKKSANRKLAPVEKVPYDHKQFKFRPTPRAPYCASTYVSIAATCPDTCAFKREPDGTAGGCYVDSDHFMRRAMVTLDTGARGKSGLDVIRDEVREIDLAWPRGIPQDGARGGRDLRLHIGGDVPDGLAAQLLARAAAHWLSRGGGRVWTFTHSWLEIERENFGKISVLASVEQDEQIGAAVQAGYAPALVVARFPNGKRLFTRGGVSFIPCPAETLSKTCVTCRLCLDADKLSARGQGIAFEVHGLGSAAAKSALVPLRVRTAA